MKNILLALATCFVLTLPVHSQTTFAAPPADCPADKVCISREAAQKALADADRVKALETEIRTLKESVIPQLKDELNAMRVEFARASGELTGCRTSAIRDAAMIELLSKMVRPKKVGLINLF